MAKSVFWIFIILLASCNSIVSGEQLNASDIDRIRKLGLLDSNETIIKFYSNDRMNTAGNFFTYKRFGKYWLNSKGLEEKMEVHYAFYEDVASIDTIYYCGATYSPYMLITKKDGSDFKVCFSGSRDKLTATFNEGIRRWKLKQQQ
ncbi:MAG: hypothetical protein PSX81_08095 [bacterium]|nr:hypothetical protein [bacterium]